MEEIRGSRTGFHRRRGGVAEVDVTGLAWRSDVCQQVFEEGAVDCAKALAAWSESRSGTRKGVRVGFPRFKKKSDCIPSFRLRDKNSSRRRPSIRVGDGPPRSVTLPGVGVVLVHDDTRPLRRLLAKKRARILFATMSLRSGHWWLALNVEAADLHPATQHPPRESGDQSGWVGLDRGLLAFVVAATSAGCEVARIETHQSRWHAEYAGNGTSPNHSLGSRKDRRTELPPPHGLVATTIECAMSDSTSYIKYPTSWSRPTTGSSSKTSMWRECSRTVGCPERSATLPGPNLRGLFAISNAGMAGQS